MDVSYLISEDKLNYKGLVKPHGMETFYEAFLFPPWEIDQKGEGCVPF